MRLLRLVPFWMTTVMIAVSMRSAVALAQDASFRGTVVDPQGAVVSNALITLTPKGAPSPRTTRSQADGIFSFDAVQNGSYVLQVESPGFQLWTQMITITDLERRADVVLQVAGVSESVNVSGSTPLNLTQPGMSGSRLGLTPLETPASVAVLSGDDIRDQGTATVAEAKAEAPGITSANSPGNGNNFFSARGFTGENSVKQLYNGMEIYNAGGVVSFPFDPWNVDHIDVLYGPAGVLYGTGAVGGAINVVAKRPDPTETRGEVTLSGGMFGTFHEAADFTGPISDRVSYRFDVSRYDSQGWIDRGQSSSTAASLSFRFDARPNLHVIVANDFGQQNPVDYEGTPVVNGQLVTGLRFQNYNIDGARLFFGDDWTTVETVWDPSAAVSVHNTTFFLYHTRDYLDATLFTFKPATDSVVRTSYRDIDNTYETQYGDTGYVKIHGSFLGRANDVLVGFDANGNYYHRNDNTRAGSSTVGAFNFEPGYYSQGSTYLSTPFYRTHVDQVAGFLEDRLALAKNLSVVVGARSDHYAVNLYTIATQLTTDSSYNPLGWHVGMVYDVVPGVALYGQYAVASDPVNSLPSIPATQQTFTLSKGWEEEAGLKGTSKRFAWTLAAYHIVKNNLMTPAVDNPNVSVQVGEQSSRGVEASGGLRLGTLRVDANGSILKAYFDDFTEVVAGTLESLAGNIPLDVPERTANLRALWDAAPGWQFRAMLRYVGRRYSDNDDLATTLMPAYHVLDLGMRWKATPKLTFDVRLDNVFDDIYAETGSTTQWILGEPRAASLAANVKF
jgi:iron complex outermembrane receptor protein